MHKWNYKYIIIFLISIIIAIYILTSPILRGFISSLGDYSYLGALIAGFFFASGFTAAPATASFLIFGQSNNPILLGLVGGAGAMLADTLIFLYIKKGLSPDLKYLLKKSKLTKLKKLRHTKLGWIIPLTGGIIIASPLPDELGSFVFGISNYSTKKFLIYSYLLNSLGLIIISLLG